MFNDEQNGSKLLKKTAHGGSIGFFEIENHERHYGAQKANLQKVSHMVKVSRCVGVFTVHLVITERNSFQETHTHKDLLHFCFLA